VPAPKTEVERICQPEVARAAGAKIVVTDNRRHFLAALRYGIRVETPTEFLAGFKSRRG
jgi:hypothetical protein